MTRKSYILTGALVVAALLLAGVLFALAFGTPQAPERAVDTGSVPANPAAEGLMDEVTGDSEPDGSARADEATEIPPPDPGSPLAVEIPGCVCHSDDPALVEEHAGYRMNQCFGCHAGGMPEMGQ